VSRAGRAAAALGLGLLALAASLALAEALFRVYERHFLVEEVAIGADDFDLAALRYNDVDGFLPAAKPADEFRILAFGDSFTEAIARALFAYTGWLQRLLTQAAGHPVRVVNFGVGMTSFEDYLAEERSWGGRAEHDAVLFGVYSGNDFAETAQFALQWEGGVTRNPRMRGDAEVRRVGPAVDVPARYPLRIIDYVWALYVTHALTASGSEPEVYNSGIPLIPDASYGGIQGAMAIFYEPARIEEIYAGSLHGLDTLMRRAVALERAGTRVAISVAPPDFAVSPLWRERALAARKLSEADLRFDLPEQIVAAVAARHGFAGPLVMFDTCLRAAEARGEDTYYETNTHWSARGNEIAGRVLALRLAQAWQLGAGRVDAGDLPDCDSAPPELDADVVRAVNALLDRIAPAAVLRDRVVAALREDEKYDSAEAIAPALARAGLRAAPGRIRGGVDYATRGAGRSKLRLHGRARDSEAPESWLLLLIFRRGKLAGVAFTPSGIASDDAVFYFDLVEEVPMGIWGRGAQVIAVSPDGAWSELPVTPGPVHQRLAG
jgi:hypothetical protein